MADLPDLNTDNVSVLSYWNAISDGGASDIDPEEVLSDGNIQDYTLYDNGVEINNYSTVTGRSAKARVKSDGWFVVWMDDTVELVENSGGKPEGPWSIVDDWTEGPVDSDNNDYPKSATDHTLVDAISSMVNELSNSAGISFSNSDAGFYNYLSPDSDVTTIKHCYIFMDDSYPKSASFGPTDGTTIAFAYAAGHCTNDSQYNSFTEVTIGGNHVVNVTDTSKRYSAYDLQNRGMMPSNGNTTSFTVDCEGGVSHLGMGGGLIVIGWN